MTDNMKSTKDFTDDVNGVIVGGEYGTCWVSYENRRQGSVMCAANMAEGYALCEAKMKELQEDQGEVLYLIYPNKDGWKFCFDGI